MREISNLKVDSKEHSKALRTETSTQKDLPREFQTEIQKDLLREFQTETQRVGLRLEGPVVLVGTTLDGKSDGDDEGEIE